MDRSPSKNPCKQGCGGQGMISLGRYLMLKKKEVEVELERLLNDKFWSLSIFRVGGTNCTCH